MSFDPGFGRVVPANVRAIVRSGWWQPREYRDGYHEGIDIGVGEGTPILAAAAGKVVTAKTVSTSAAGIYIVLRHASGIFSRYLHLSKIVVLEGSDVRAGQLIGYSGSSGIQRSAAHLHFDLKAPTTLVPAIVDAAGAPTIGWPSPEMSGLGVAIPAEPWVPVDEYEADVISDAKAHRVPLYRDMPHVGSFLAKVGLAGFVAWGIYKLVLK